MRKPACGRQPARQLRVPLDLSDDTHLYERYRGATSEMPSASDAAPRGTPPLRQIGAMLAGATQQRDLRPPPCETRDTRMLGNETRQRKPAAEREDHASVVSTRGRRCRGDQAGRDRGQRRARVAGQGAFPRVAAAARYASSVSPGSEAGAATTSQPRGSRNRPGSNCQVLRPWRT